MQVSIRMHTANSIILYCYNASPYYSLLNNNMSKSFEYIRFEWRLWKCTRLGNCQSTKGRGVLRILSLCTIRWYKNDIKKKWKKKLYYLYNKPYIMWVLTFLNITHIKKKYFFGELHCIAVMWLKCIIIWWFIIIYYIIWNILTFYFVMIR